MFDVGSHAVEDLAARIFQPLALSKRAAALARPTCYVEVAFGSLRVVALRHVFVEHGRLKISFVSELHKLVLVA